MKNFVLVFVFIFSSLLVKSQLLPSIGLTSLPADNTPICSIPWYLGSFYTSGLQEGSYAPDFKLYNLSGDSLILSNALANGKPVLLVAGSLTCPVFMGKIPTINQIISTYGNDIQVYIIYTLEAHPTDTSVYFGYVNVGTANTNAGILFAQPTTYGERKHMVDTLSYWASSTAPIFIDGPCNTWWSTFGPAPNNAYLIDTNGQIVSKHGWFHKNPDHIFCDLDSLLGVTSGLCTTTTTAGQFVLQVLNNSSNGMPGSILYDYANLINPGADPVTIGIKKIQKYLPAGWQTAFCADVCYSPNDDSITITLAPNDTLLFSLDFITNAIADTGGVQVGFRNVMNTNNKYSVYLKGSTLPTAVNQSNTTSCILYPNPTKQSIFIKGTQANESWYLYDWNGRLCKKGITLEGTTTLDVHELTLGAYCMVIQHTDATECWVIQKE
jgi:hypothetical protein